MDYQALAAAAKAAAESRRLALQDQIRRVRAGLDPAPGAVPTSQAAAASAAAVAAAATYAPAAYAAGPYMVPLPYAAAPGGFGSPARFVGA